MSVILDRKLQQAAAALKAGDIGRALSLTRDVLERAPRHPRALELAASAYLQQGDGARAGKLLEQALAADPDNPHLLEGLAVSALDAGNFADAERWLRRAMSIGRASTSAFNWLGVAVSSQGRHAEALEIFRRGAIAAPEDPGTHLNVGNELMRLGKIEAAIASYERALRLNSGYAEGHNALGCALKARGDLEGAAARFQEAIRLRGDYAEAHDNLGVTLSLMDREAEAEASFRKAVSLAPDNAYHHSGLAANLAKQKRWREAIGEYEQCLQLRPDLPEALCGLGAATFETGNSDDAMAYIRRAIELRRDYAEAHETLAMVLLRLGREEEGNASFRQAIELEPETEEVRIRYGDALLWQQRWDEALEQYAGADRSGTSPGVQFAVGNVHLFRQDFERAWPGYEQRLKYPHYRARHFRRLSESIRMFERLPRWQGPGEAGVRSVAVWTELAVGEQVLFSTLIPDLTATGLRVVYEVDQRLIGAYQRAYPDVSFVATQDPPDEVLRRADRVLSVGSLPLLFRRSREAFARQPAQLLSALPQRVSHYRERLNAVGAGFRIALSWRSRNADEWRIRSKVMPLAEFAPLLGLPGIQFVDVQYGDTRTERLRVEQMTNVPLVHFDEVDYYGQLEELLAILEACDLVITTSNVTAHFAGALGKRTWLIYPCDRAPFHYWAHGGSHRCLWYPSVEIVTGAHMPDWSSLVSHVKDRLARELAIRSDSI